jgi:hypothetical protein
MQEALNFCLSIQVQKGDTRQSFALARSWIGAKPEMLAAKNNTRSRVLIARRLTLRQPNTSVAFGAKRT